MVCRETYGKYSRKLQLVVVEPYCTHHTHREFPSWFSSCTWQLEPHSWVANFVGLLQLLYLVCGRLFLHDGQRILEPRWLTSDLMQFLQNEWRHGRMRGSVYSLEHLVQLRLAQFFFLGESVYTQTLAFSYSLFYLQNQISNYKQTTKSTVSVNYDYATICNTAVV